MIFFAGHLVVNLAGWEEVMLFFVGIILLGIEIFVTPGFGVLGVAGILAIIVSLVLAMTSLPIDVSFQTGNLTTQLLHVMAAMGVVILLFFVAAALLPKAAPMRRRLVLDAAIVETASGSVEGRAAENMLSVGMTGTAESYLRPADGRLFRRRVHRERQRRGDRTDSWKSHHRSKSDLTDPLRLLLQ